jgi:hypothetical protein
MYNYKNPHTNITGDDDAGKLTIGVTPQYSSLTNGYGTTEKIITNNFYSKPSSPQFGANTWISDFEDIYKLFDKRYKPKTQQYMPNNNNRYTLSGEFIDNGPFPSNYQL